MIITLLVSTSLEISKESLSKVETVKEFNQNYQIIEDIKAIIHKNISMIEDELMLEIAFLPFIIEEKGLKLKIELEPLSDKIDINYAFKDENSTSLYLPIFESIFQKYEVRDIAIFQDLILDTIDLDLESRSGYDSEILLNDRSFTNGAIFDKYQFNKILNQYSFLSNDSNIHRVPWSELIYFREHLDSNQSKKDKSKEIERPKLFINFINSELLEAFDIEKPEGGFLDSKELSESFDSEFLENYNFAIFSKGESFLVLCTIDYIFDTISTQIKLIYDLGKKKVVTIEEIL